MFKNVDIGKYLDDLFKQDEEAALKRKLEKERKMREKEEKQKELDFKKKTYNLSGIAKLINYMKKNERQVLNVSLEGKYFIKRFDQFLDISSSDGRRVFLNVPPQSTSSTAPPEGEPLWDKPLIFPREEHSILASPSGGGGRRPEGATYNVIPQLLQYVKRMSQGTKIKTKKPVQPWTAQAKCYVYQYTLKNM